MSIPLPNTIKNNTMILRNPTTTSTSVSTTKIPVIIRVNPPMTILMSSLMTSIITTIPAILLPPCMCHILRLDQSRYRSTSNTGRRASQSHPNSPAGTLNGAFDICNYLSQDFQADINLRQPPPTDSKPEAINFPQTHYEMSSDTAPFVPPPRYPSPPRDMWFEVPKERPAPPTAKPRAIFPWETHQPRASRVFADFSPEPEPTETHESKAEASGERHDSTEWRNQAEPFTTEASAVEAKSELETPLSQYGQTTSSDPWSSFPRSNAWDDVPQIERYVEGLQQQHRRTKSQGLKLDGLPPSEITQEDVIQRRGSKLTDFPSEVERPSLPVTPAPIRRPKFWGGGAPGIGPDDDEGEDDEQLPAAEGVPAQSEWVCVHGILWKPDECLCDLANVLRFHKDPLAQLQKLAQQQSDLLRQKLGGSGESGGHDEKDFPKRSLPYGSEDAKSPTYVAQSATVLSPKPVKPGSGSSSVRTFLESEPESVPRSTPGVSSNIPEPSYHGPGAAFEKDDNYMTQDTPAPATEEELDVLDT